MKLSASFDSGCLHPFSVSGNEITFDLRPAKSILYFLVNHPPAALKVVLKLGEKQKGHLKEQGLIAGAGPEAFLRIPFKETAPNVLTAEINTAGRKIYIATRYPYGRAALDRLMSDVSGRETVKLRTLEKDSRTVPVFDIGEVGKDEGLHHYFIAGEDSWETAGSWTADAMVRYLSSDKPAAKRARKDACIHIVPLVSPVSSSLPGGSYTTLEGKSIYGAATWGDRSPPPEYALLRREVTDRIKKRKLGILLTIHSWQAQRDFTGMETIRTAGRRRLSGKRAAWALRTMRRLMRGVPHGKVALKERIWHPGLARDHLLKRYNAVTFRVEITTWQQDYAGFARSGRKLAENFSMIKDWAPVISKKD